MSKNTVLVAIAAVTLPIWILPAVIALCIALVCTILWQTGTLAVIAVMELTGHSEAAQDLGNSSGWYGSD